MTNNDDFFDDDDDFFGDSNDILDDDDNSDDDSLSFEEQERRQAAFQKEAKKRIRMVMKPKEFSPAERLEAARWLGESGELTAIKPLAMAYQRDKTPGMKKVAGYALGQFRSLEIVLNDPELQDIAYENIEKIVMHGEFGKPANVRPFRILQAILTLSLVVLLGIGVILAANNDGADAGAVIADATEEPLATPTPDSIDLVTADLVEQYNLISEDIQAIDAQLDIAQERGGQDCEAAGTFNQPDEYTLTPLGAEDPTLSAVSTNLEEVRQTVNSIIGEYNQACADNRGFTAEEIFNLSEQLFTTQAPLNDTIVPGLAQFDSSIAPELSEMETEAVQVTPPSEETAMVEATAEVTATEPPDTREAEFALRTIIDQMIGINGILPTMETYWTQAAQGSDINCLQPQPIVPENYTLPDELAGTSEALQGITDNTNGALDLMRNAVGIFFASCDDGSLQANADAQLTAIETARGLLEFADQELNAFRRSS